MSITGIGGIITVVFAVLRLFGVDLPDDTAQKAAEAIATIIGIVLLVYGQLRRPDLKMGLIRKS
jgi:uncharacterized membrane protein YfcA